MDGSGDDRIQGSEHVKWDFLGVPFPLAGPGMGPAARLGWGGVELGEQTEKSDSLAAMPDAEPLPSRCAFIHPPPWLLLSDGELELWVNENAKRSPLT